MTYGFEAEPKQVIGFLGAIMAILFFLIPCLQIVQLCRKTLRPVDTSYMVFIVNGTMSIFFFSDFFRIRNIVGIVPHSISIPLNFVYYAIYCVYRYNFPECCWYIAGAVLYVLTLLSLAIFLLPLYTVATTALVINVFVGLATLQKLVYFLIVYIMCMIALCMQDVRLQGTACGTEHLRLLLQRILAYLRDFGRDSRANHPQYFYGNHQFLRVCLLHGISEQIQRNAWRGQTGVAQCASPNRGQKLQYNSISKKLVHQYTY
eukprot:TRINITY_DN89150_c0_g1_i1.p1 TRINITY_DN89150_c0_g1~~TRINITY_DN89150_c0_g1_i1.p1  ORF type:complete len:298 (+),score=-16.41 TRINITY_DN89150_c0_g1_i1:114-896(+)